MAMNVMRRLSSDCRLFCSARLYSRRSVYREDEDDKSRYLKDEEGQKPRVIHGEPYPDWRNKWGERKGEWYSKFKLFSSEKNPHPDVLAGMQKIPELNMEKIKNWWGEMKEKNEVVNQRFMTERVEILGANIGAAHFLLYRKASIRLKGSQTWIKGDPTRGELPQVPDRFKERFYIEAIDASTFQNGGLRYEGLENLANLTFLKWLSVRNNTHIDEWGVDRIAGQLSQSLEYLDISGCTVKPGSIIALARMTALNVLVLTDPGDDKAMETVLAALEEEKPNLIIKYEPREQTYKEKQT